MTENQQGSSGVKRAGKLEVSAPGDREILLSRVFNAPRHLVFKAMTEPELLKRWFSGPPGWSLDECEVDLRVGGSYRYVWRGPDGNPMGMRGVYREIVVPERVVATEKFDDPWYPGEAVGTMTLVEHLGMTTLSTRVQYESNEIRDAVLKTPMEEGVAYGYDRLEDLLTTL